MSQKQTNESKEVNRKVYTIEEIVYEDGHCDLVRSNTGFTIYEILALVSIVQDDMFSILKSQSKKYDKVTKQVVSHE